MATETQFNCSVNELAVREERRGGWGDEQDGRPAAGASEEGERWGLSVGCDVIVTLSSIQIFREISYAYK